MQIAWILLVWLLLFAVERILTRILESCWKRVWWLDMPLDLRWERVPASPEIAAILVDRFRSLTISIIEDGAIETLWSILSILL